MMLQQISENSQKVEVSSMSHYHLSLFIEPFLMQLETLRVRLGVSECGILRGLNPMRALVVLYNWINSAHFNPTNPR